MTQLARSWFCWKRWSPASLTLWKGIIATQPTVLPSTTTARSTAPLPTSLKPMMTRLSVSSSEMRSTAPVRSDTSAGERPGSK